MTDPCARDPGRIDALRDWAWESGRTDIVLDLDLHASAWAFHDSPTRPNLVRLSAILPADHARGGLAASVRRMAVAGCQADDLHCLQQVLRAWCPELCTRITADLQEMTGQMARLHAEAEGVAPAAPEAVRELADASRYREREPASANGARGPGDQAADGAARTHAAERCANAAVHSFSCATDLSDPEGSPMMTTSSGLAAMPCLGLAAAWRAEVTAPGDVGCGGAPEPASRPC